MHVPFLWAPMNLGIRLFCRNEWKKALSGNTSKLNVWFSRLAFQRFSRRIGNLENRLPGVSHAEE